MAENPHSKKEFYEFEGDHYPTISMSLEIIKATLEETECKEVFFKDKGGFESALHAPYGYGYTSFFERMAALTRSLIKNHSLNDGNKRSAFAILATTLEYNGLYLKSEFDEPQHVEFVILIATDQINVQDIAMTLERSCTSEPPPEDLD